MTTREIIWTGIDGREHRANSVHTADAARRREFRRAGKPYRRADGDIRRADGQPLSDSECFVLADADARK